MTIFREKSIQNFRENSLSLKQLTIWLTRVSASFERKITC